MLPALRLTGPRRADRLGAWGWRVNYGRQRMQIIRFCIRGAAVRLPLRIVQLTVPGSMSLAGIA
jgi:hypothetical protein